MPFSRARRISTTSSSARISTLSSIRTLRLATELAGDRGLLDISVVIALGEIDPGPIPEQAAISTLTLAELTVGPLAASDDIERARRRRRLQIFESSVETLFFDSRCARAHGQVYAAVTTVGRKARGGRIIDLMIAATALANDLPLYTCNAKDLHGLEDLIEIVAC